MDMREQVTCPPEVLAQCQALLEQREFPWALYLREGRAIVLQQTRSDWSCGNAAWRGRSTRSDGSCGRSGNRRHERRISMFAVMGSLGPMIGLLGTLKGMIGSFGEIARFRRRPESEYRCGAYFRSVAVDVRRRGSVSAAIYFFAVFKNRVSHLSVIGALKADEFLRQVSAALKQKTPMPRVLNTNRLDNLFTRSSYVSRCW